MKKTWIGRIMTLSGDNRLTAAATGLRVDVAAATALTMLAISSAIVTIFAVSQFSQAKADMFAGLRRRAGADRARIALLQSRQRLV